MIRFRADPKRESKMTMLGLITGHPKRAVKQLYNWGLMRYGKSPLRLHIGCGQRKINGFVNIDRNSSPATDYVSDTITLPCRDGSVERIETYHVIEHIPRPVVRKVLAEWRRVLKVGGCLVIECPDFDEAITQYLSGNQEMLFSVFGRYRFPGDEHAWGYSAVSLRELVESEGFSGKLCPPTDYHKDTEPCLRIECVKL